MKQFAPHVLLFMLLLFPALSGAEDAVGPTAVGRALSVVLPTAHGPRVAAPPAGFTEGKYVQQILRSVISRRPEAGVDASKLIRRVAETYAQIEKDPDFKSLPSALHPTLAGRKGSPCHYFLFLPPGCGEKKKSKGPLKEWPMLIFLHGGGGNIKIGFWALAQEAEKRGCIVVCPTYDNGQWGVGKAKSFMWRVVKDVSGKYRVDKDRLLLAGASNGAAGVWEISRKPKRPLQGVASISGPFNGHNAVRPLSGPPLFIVHGARDKTIPVAISRDAYKNLSKLRHGTVYKEYPDEGHFVFFTRGQEILPAMFDWWEGLGAAITPATK